MHGAKYFRERRKWLQIRSRLGVLARERNRMARSMEAVEVGRIDFSGKMFGHHCILCLHRDGDTSMMLNIDGIPFKPKTYRGVLKLLAKRLTR